jgi:hypothetical protein
VAIAVAPTPSPAPVAPTPVVAHPSHPASVASARTVHAPRTPSHGTPAPTLRPSGGGSGFLSISTRPASRCTVAGQAFSTPRLRLELPAGTHRVNCSSDAFNVTGTFSVTIRPGQETRLANQQLN